MARGNWREYLHGPTVKPKKYLYILRPLLACRWIEAGRGMAPVALILNSSVSRHQKPNKEGPSRKAKDFSVWLR